MSEALDILAGSERNGIYKIDQTTTVWVVALAPIVYAAFTISFYDTQYMRTFTLSLILSILLYKANEYIIPNFKDLLLKAGLSGKDLNKPGKMEDKKPVYPSPD